MPVKDKYNSVFPETHVYQTAAKQMSELAENSAFLQDGVSEAMWLFTTQCEPTAWNQNIHKASSTH